MAETKGRKLGASRDFPGGPVVKNLPSNAGDAGLIPGRGSKIPHITEQLNLCVTSRESMKVKVAQLYLWTLWTIYIYTVHGIL